MKWHFLPKTLSFANFTIYSIFLCIKLIKQKVKLKILVHFSSNSAHSNLKKRHCSANTIFDQVSVNSRLID